LALLHFVHPGDGPDSPFVLSVVFLSALLALSQLSAELVLSLPRVSRPGRRDACVVFHDELLYRRESRGIDPVAQLFYLQAIDGPLLHGAAAILLHGISSRRLAQYEGLEAATLRRLVEDFALEVAECP